MPNKERMIDIKDKVKIKIDSIWYRGTVVGIANNQCQVEYTRYGAIFVDWFNRDDLEVVR